MWRKKPQSTEDAFRVLVRHADAGLRSQWHGADEWRGLTDVGHGQAGAVAGLLGNLSFLRLLSSPSLRCRQTVVPLALAQGLDVEPCWQLGATVEAAAVLDLLADPATESSVLCTHRETLQSLFGCLLGTCAPVPGAADPMDMSATWIVRGPVTDPKRARWEYLGSGAALLLERGVATVR
jgi:phosphohistidine phosphatase SixA